MAKKQSKETIESTLKADISERINLTEKHLPWNEDLGWYEDFTANGKKYTCETWKSWMPPKRYIAWQKWSIIAATGQTFQELFDFGNAFEQLHRDSYADASKKHDLGIKIHEYKNFIKNFGDKRFYGCYMCACIFFIREGEDILEFNEDYQEKKINELIEEGFDSRDFLEFALSSVPGFPSAYKNLIGA